MCVNESKLVRLKKNYFDFENVDASQASFIRYIEKNVGIS